MAIELPPDELEKLGQHVLAVLRGCKERQLRDAVKSQRERNDARARIEYLGRELDRLTIAVEGLTKENAALRRANRALEQARSNKGKLAAFRRFLTGEE